MNRKLLIVSFFATILLLTACSDFFEKNISKLTVYILAPANGSVLSSSMVTFWWDTVQSATQYEIQVVSPSFANTLYLEMDSYVMGNRLIYNFSPGAYQWKIRAVNNSSSTAFFTSGFSIDSNLNLENNTVQIISPSNNYITNNLYVSFSWFPVPNTTDYRFQIVNSSGNVVFVNADYQSDTISYTFFNSDTYTWMVRAQNNNSVSQYNTYTLLIDNIPPPVPINLSPANGATVSNPFTLSWTQPIDNGSAIHDSLYLYKDPAQDTLLVAIRPATTSFTDSLAAGNYYWKLRAIDSAGNYSSYSSLYGFITH